MTEEELIPGKLYRPLPITSKFFFHKEGTAEPSNNSKVYVHSFLLFLESYQTGSVKFEHVFLDANGERVALWARNKKTLSKWFERII